MNLITLFNNCCSVITGCFPGHSCPLSDVCSIAAEDVWAMNLCLHSADWYCAGHMAQKRLSKHSIKINN